jgi:hypothetical protein
MHEQIADGIDHQDCAGIRQFRGAEPTCTDRNGLVTPRLVVDGVWRSAVASSFAHQTGRRTGSSLRESCRSRPLAGVQRTRDDARCTR